MTPCEDANVSWADQSFVFVDKFLKQGIYVNNVSKFIHMSQKTHLSSATNFSPLIMPIDDCSVSSHSERVNEM
jgi:hypothetical protein